MMKNLPWIVGTGAAIAFFAVFEYFGFAHPDRVNTLSRAIATMGAQWPFSIYLLGFFSGTLSAHLFWPWAKNPEGQGAG